MTNRDDDDDEEDDGEAADMEEFEESGLLDEDDKVKIHMRCAKGDSFCIIFLISDSYDSRLL